MNAIARVTRRLETFAAGVAVGAMLFFSGHQGYVWAGAQVTPDGPADVWGLYLWYRADAIAGLKDGDAVDRWEDSGPRKIDLDRCLGSPMFVKECIGGLPAIRFHEGRTNGLRAYATAPLLAANPNFTMFVVAKIMRPQAEQVHPLGWGNGGLAAGKGMFLELESGRLDLATGFSADASTPNDSYAGHFGKATIILCARTAGPMSTTTQIAFDGRDVGVSGTSIVPNVSVTPLIVGADQRLGNVSPEMEVAEIIIFTRSLTASEQNRVGYYLAAKYRLDTAYLKPEKPTVGLEVRAQPADVESVVGFVGRGLLTQGAVVEVVAHEIAVVRKGQDQQDYFFDHWEGGGASPTLTVTMDRDKRVTAVYQERRMEFHVSLNGRDNWSGRLHEPNAARTDGPFATIAGARDAIRKLKLKWGGELRAPVKVLIRGGKYYLNEPLLLGPQDSGTADCPVTYTADTGEEPTLSGGIRVTGWQPYKDKVLRCTLPNTQSGHWKFRQLFYDGKPQIRARTPDLNRQDPLQGGWARMAGPAEPGSQTAFKYSPGTFQRRWAKPQEAEVNLFIGQDWANNIVPIAAADEQECVIKLVHSTTRFTNPPLPFDYPTPFAAGQRFRVENVLEELDQPGEWCWDSGEGTLYFWPPDDQLASGEVVIPRLHNLVALHGASHVTIAGFTFTETNGGDNFHPDGCEGVGAMFPMPGWTYCGDALHLKDAEHCLIERNRFRNIGGNAIYLEGHNTRNVIRQNELAHVGACGVSLAGGGDHYPIFNQIVDNHIHHTGRINLYSAGVFLGLSEGNVVGHNSIHDVPHHAINLGNTGRSHNVIEYNDIRRTCLETSDTGAINCWMEEGDRNTPRQGHIIRYNLIVDSRERGIYLDNYTSNCQVLGNIIVRANHWAIIVHGGKNNVIENNIIVSPSGAAVAYLDGIDGLMPHMAGFFGGNHFCRNIIYGAKQTAHIALKRPDRALAESDFNLFFRVDDASAYLEESRRVGHERHSQVADPLFVDAGKDDYRLQPQSPALKLGFQPIDVTQIGSPE